MRKLMDTLYSNLKEAKAFALSFTNFAYFYDDVCRSDFQSITCECCGKTVQVADYLSPQANCKKPVSILHSLEFGVSQEVRNSLIAQFDITEDDFRPILNKKGKLVYYQITPQHIMLPLHKVNNWPVRSVCPQCGNVRYECPGIENEKKEDYYYISQDALDDMHDLNVTFEKMGHLDIPLFIISRRVYDYLTECYPRTHYFPFFLKKISEEKRG